MPSPELYDLTVAEAHRPIRSGDSSSATELTSRRTDRIAAVDELVQAYVTATEDVALAQAAEADRRIAAGDIGPARRASRCASRTCFCTEGVPTTGGSRILAGYRAALDGDGRRAASRRQAAG